MHACTCGPMHGTMCTHTHTIPMCMTYIHTCMHMCTNTQTCHLILPHLGHVAASPCTVPSHHLFLCVALLLQGIINELLAPSSLISHSASNLTSLCNCSVCSDFFSFFSYEQWASAMAGCSNFMYTRSGPADPLFMLQQKSWPKTEGSSPSFDLPSPLIKHSLDEALPKPLWGTDAH